MSSKTELNYYEKESIKDYMKVLKDVDPNLSDRMRSYYKKQFVEILLKKREENLVYKLLGKIEELKGDNQELQDQIDVYKKR